jgi:four helix bundle protein
VNYLNIATGSLLELDYQAMLVQRLGIGDAQSLSELRAFTLRVRQMLSKLRSSLKSRRRVASAAP